MVLYSPWAFVLWLAAILGPIVTIIAATTYIKQGFSFVRNQAPPIPKWLWITGLVLLALFMLTILFDINIVVYP